MKASIGRTVIVRGPAVASNGSDRAPAIITRAWGDQDTQLGPVAINLQAFPDAGVPVSLTSVMLFDSEASAGDAGGYAVAFWPSRD